MNKIKSNTPKIKVACTNCFKSNHIVFNFAYISYCEDFNKDDKRALVDRMMEISKVTYLELRRWDKYKGVEEIIIDIKKEIPSGFINDIEPFDGKYSILRLYKNNYPTPARVIGKIVNKVFYIFYIDIKGKLYNHGS